MKVAVCVVLAGLVGLCASQVVQCANSANSNINNDTATFGCSSLSYNYINNNYYLSASDARLIAFNAGSVDSTYNVLTWTPLSRRPSIRSGGFFSTRILESTRTDYQYWVPPGPGSFVSFQGNSYDQPGAWTATVTPAPDYYTLTFGQTTSTERQQSGGFVYFALPNGTYGSSLNLQVTVNQYQGLQAPGVFLSANTLPTLTYYDHSNNTQGAPGGAQTAQITVTSPANGWWVAGVFLYGTTADIDVIATWSYNFKLLANGVATTGTVANGQAVYYQVVVPVNSNKLLLQISRQVPGGHVSLYLGYTDPLQTTPITVLNTAVDSYQTYTVQNPNPSGNQYPNPGVYIIALTCDTSQCGYIVEASWA